MSSIFNLELQRFATKNPWPHLSSTPPISFITPAYSRITISFPSRPSFNPKPALRFKFRRPSIIPADDHWSTWTSILSIGTIALWTEEKTRIGRVVSAALVSSLVGMGASNLGLIPFKAPAYDVVLNILLPLSVPLLLLRADLRRVLNSTGKLLLAFIIGSIGTMIGTVVAFKLIPMRSLGDDNWKIAAALMGSYIGGSINFVAISDALSVSPSVIAAGLAADHVICALHFMILFALSSGISSEQNPQMETQLEADSNNGNNTLQTSFAMTFAFIICMGSYLVAKALNFDGFFLPIITAVAVTMATLFPKQCGALAAAGDTVAAILMQVFFVVLGASGSVWNMVRTAPCVFAFGIVQVAVHLAVILAVGKMMNLDMKLLLLASNANIGGPTTVCGMATAKGWKSLTVPAILSAIFGVSIATYLGLAMGMLVLRRM